MKKKIVSLLLIASIVLALVPNVYFQIFAQATNTIKIGDYVQMGKYYSEPIIWRCVDIDENGPLMLSDKILTKKPYDASGSHKYLDGTPQSDDYGMREDYGSDLWETSNIRSWLNSTATAGKVIWLDGCPPSADKVASADGKGGKYYAYDNEKGFLAEGNFTANEISAVKSVTQKSLLNYVDSEKLGVGGSAVHKFDSDISDVVQNYDDTYYQNVADKMFLLDVRQLYNVYLNSSVLGADYYLGKPTKKAVEISLLPYDVNSGDSSWSYWLRTPYNDIYHFSCVRTVSTLSEGVFGADPNYYITTFNGNGCGVRPAFYIDMSLIDFTYGKGSLKEPYSQSPPVPSLNTITNIARLITGKAVNGGVVTVTTGTKKHTARVLKGVWKVVLPNVLKAGTKVSALVKINGFGSAIKYVYVIPATPTFSALKANAAFVKGTATKGSTVYSKIGSKIYYAKASTKTGSFAVKIPKIKKGTIVSVYCKAGGQISASRIVKAV
ncbi:MAG: DUF6273 domain-containing protein [Clostridia bacterium]